MSPLHWSLENISVLRASKVTLLIAIFVFFLTSPSFAENYYQPPPSCPPGTRPHRTTVGEVSEKLLPKYTNAQGISKSCSIHAAMVALNALNKFAHPDRSILSSWIPFL